MSFTPRLGRDLVEGQTTYGWKACLNALVLAHPDRLDHLLG